MDREQLDELEHVDQAHVLAHVVVFWFDLHEGFERLDLEIEILKKGFRCPADVLLVKGGSRQLILP